MNENQIRNYRDTTNKSVPYNFPTTRECSECKRQKLRSQGKWIMKTVWVCNPCLNGEHND